MTTTPTPSQTTWEQDRERLWRELASEEERWRRTILRMQVYSLFVVALLVGYSLYLAVLSRADAVERQAIERYHETCVQLIERRAP